MSSLWSPNDAIYYSSPMDEWSPGYLGNYPDILNATTRSHMSHLPLHPPQSTRYASGDSSVNSADHSYHGNHRNKSSNNDQDGSRGYSRHRSSQVHPPQPIRSAVSIPRWNPISTNRQAGNSQLSNDYYSSSSPHTPGIAHSRTKVYSSFNSRAPSQPTSTALSTSSSLMSVVTRPSCNSDTLEAKKKELAMEEHKLASIVWEKKKLEGREQRCNCLITKLRSEIKSLTATMAASSNSAATSSSNAQSTLASSNVIRFASLSLKYNLPPTCDILPISTFIPVHGFRGQFKAPPALGDPSLKVLLRICNLNREKPFQTDHINCKFEIIINNTIVHAGKKKPHRGPLDITPFCTSFNNNIEIKLVTPPAGFVDEPLPKEAVAHIVYAYKLETSASIAALNSEKYQRSQANTEQLIRSKFSNECGIVDESDLKVSLTCQITKSRLTLPCTGVNCTHLTYFNGDSFLNMYHTRDDWSCPICRIPIGLDELRVDSLLKTILKESNPQTLQITFDRHAKWSEFVDCKKEIIKEIDPNSASSTAKKPAIDVITIDDSDDDALPNQQKPSQAPQTSAPRASGSAVQKLTLRIKKPSGQSNQVSSRGSSNSSNSPDSDLHLSSSSRSNQPATRGRKRALTESSEEDEEEDEEEEEEDRWPNQCASDDSSETDPDSEKSLNSTDSSSESSSESSRASSSPVLRRTRRKVGPARTRRK